MKPTVSADDLILSVLQRADDERGQDALLFDALCEYCHLLIVQHLIGVSIEGVELTDGQQR